MGHRSKRRKSELTDRDRYWLAHHEACDRAGQPQKAYSREHGLSVHSLYQSRKRLRSLGALPGAGAAGAKARMARQSRSAFARVSATAPQSGRLRVRLANGAVLEWDGASADQVGQVLESVSRLP